MALSLIYCYPTVNLLALTVMAKSWAISLIFCDHFCSNFSVPSMMDLGPINLRAHITSQFNLATMCCFLVALPSKHQH